MSNFEKAFKRTVGHEGAFSIDPKDRGNWTGPDVGKGELKGTKYGISAKSYPNLNIEKLTLAEAQMIYAKDFWNVLGLDGFPLVMQYQLFDAAVNHGINATKKMIQRSLGVKDDGIIGPDTRSKIFNSDPNDFCFRFLGERLTYMTNAQTWTAHGKGWARRIAGNLSLAAEDN